MKIIIEVANWMDDELKKELFNTIKSICHLLSDETLEVRKEN